MLTDMRKYILAPPQAPLSYQPAQATPSPPLWATHTYFCVHLKKKVVLSLLLLACIKFSELVNWVKIAKKIVPAKI